MFVNQRSPYTFSDKTQDRFIFHRKQSQFLKLLLFISGKVVIKTQYLIVLKTVFKTSRFSINFSWQLVTILKL